MDHFQSLRENEAARVAAARKYDDRRIAQLLLWEVTWRAAVALAAVHAIFLTAAAVSLVRLGNRSSALLIAASGIMLCIARFIIAYVREGDDSAVRNVVLRRRWIVCAIVVSLADIAIFITGTLSAYFLGAAAALGALLILMLFPKEAIA